MVVSIADHSTKGGDDDDPCATIWKANTTTCTPPRHHKYMTDRLFYLQEADILHVTLQVNSRETNDIVTMW